MAPVPGIWTSFLKTWPLPTKSSPSPATLWPSHLGQTDPSVLAKLNIVYSCLTHAPNVFFSRIRGWRASATSCKVAESTCGCRFESKCECFSVANILSLKTCNSTSSLCCPEFCGLPQCYHHHLLLFIFLPTKVVLDGDKSLLIYETLNGRGIMEAGFARKLSWGLFAVQQNSSLNMAVDATIMLLYAIYCLITAPVSTRPKDSNTLT